MDFYALFIRKDFIMHCVSLKSPFHHANRAQAGDPAGKPRLIHRRDHLIHILVRFGLLLFETPKALASGQDTPGKQLLVDAPPLGPSGGLGPAQ